MAWENLEAEILDELSSSILDMEPSVWSDGYGGPGRSPERDSTPLRITRLGRGRKDHNEIRWKRRLLAERRTRYGVADRNRAYTVRASHYAKPASMRRKPV